MPAVLLRTAGKHFQASLQAARQNFSFDRPTTPRARSLSREKTRAIAKEYDSGARNRDHLDASPKRKSVPKFLSMPSLSSPFRTPRQRAHNSSIFRSKASSASGETASSRIKALFRFSSCRDSSETFSNTSGVTSHKSSQLGLKNDVSQQVIFHRKQSDISNISSSCDDEAEASTQELRDMKPPSKRRYRNRHRSRVPAVTEKSLSAMLDPRSNTTGDLPSETDV